MQELRKNGTMLIPYCIPYIVILFLITYYFDEVAGKYPTFLPAGVLILTFFPIYIGLGCWCGRRRLPEICIIGTVLQICVCKLCISFLLPTLGVNTGEINAWFLVIAGSIIGCQLIGYWGMKRE